MPFTGVLTTPFDQRGQDIDRFPVWERKITFTIAAGDEHAKTTVPVEINGILTHITAASGTANTITGTFILSIDDNDNIEIFTAASPATPAEQASSFFNVYIPVTGTIDVGIDPNDDPTSGSWIVTIVLRGV